MKIVIDVAAWQRGFNDGLAGRSMQMGYSYASGFIEGRAAAMLRVAPARQRLFRGASSAHPAPISVDLPPRATAPKPSTHPRESKEGKDRR